MCFSSIKDIISLNIRLIIICSYNLRNNEILLGGGGLGKETNSANSDQTALHSSLVLIKMFDCAISLFQYLNPFKNNSVALIPSKMS